MSRHVVSSGQFLSARHRDMSRRHSTTCPTCHMTCQEDTTRVASDDMSCLRHMQHSLPFDAIVINWQYVGLRIPGVGERRYLEMARVLWRVCKKTLPREEVAVRNAFKINANRGHDGFRFLWDVLIRS